MDGTTEPVVAVIGHPIAGNPSQFAFERALVAMDLDWRVISFDVPAGKIAAALDGAEVLGLRGILVDPSVQEAASDWYRTRDQDSSQIDCLYRGDDGVFAACNEQRGWLQQQLDDQRQHLDRELSGCLWLGDALNASLVDEQWIGEEPLTAAPRLDQIAAADVIFVATADGGPANLDADDWPPEASDTLVIDLTAGHPDMPRLERAGYRVLSFQDRQIGTLGRCLRRWTGIAPPAEILHDAIEEYLAV